jgi:hypothetical protein
MIALEEEIGDCERRWEYAAGRKGFRYLHAGYTLRGILLRKGWTLSTPSGGTAELKG